MDTWIWVLIAAFVVSDAFVTYFVLRSVRRRKAEAMERESSDDLARKIGLE